MRSLTFFFRCLTAAIAIPLPAGPTEPGPSFDASWPDFPAPSSVLSLKIPVLPIRFENRERSDVLLTFDGRIYLDGASVPLKPVAVALRAFETKKVPLSLPVNDLNLGALQY